MFFTHQIVAGFEAERAGNAATGVAGHEEIEIAFKRVRVAHEAALGTDVLEVLLPPGDEFVRVDLVAGVPDDAVFAEVEDLMKGEAELDDAKVAGEMHRPCFERFAEDLA